jgi:SecY interacting protein Syd
MDHPVSVALWAFSQRFISQWQDEGWAYPLSDVVADLDSLCVQSHVDHSVAWLPVSRETVHPLTAVETGMELVLQDDIHAYYGSQWAADMTAMWNDQTITLLQAFNEDDLSGLQENILGHLVSQRRFKVKPTVFIAALENEQQVISVCNLTGNVLLETLGKKGNREVIATELSDFLVKLTPVVVR